MPKYYRRSWPVGNRNARFKRILRRRFRRGRTRSRYPVSRSRMRKVLPKRLRGNRRRGNPSYGYLSSTWLPDKLRTKFYWSSPFTLDPSTVVAYKVFSLASCHDPDPSGTGTDQPMGFSRVCGTGEWQYTNCSVLNAKWRIELVNSPATNLGYTLALKFFYQDNLPVNTVGTGEIPQSMVTLNNDPTSLKKRFISAGVGLEKRSRHLLSGNSHIGNYDKDWFNRSHTSATDPTPNLFMAVMLGCDDQTSDMPACTFRVHITYDALLTNPLAPRTL